jgi:oligopeptide transport system permease protein
MQSHNPTMHPLSLYAPASATDKTMQSAIVRPSITYWQDAWMRLKTNTPAMLSAVFICFIAVLAVFGPSLLSYDYETQEVWNKHSTPSFGRPALVESTIQYEPLLSSQEGVFSTISGEALLSPEKPQNLRLLQVPTTRSVVIAWDHVGGANTYSIYRSTNAETLGIPLGEVSSKYLSFQDTAGLVADQLYHYTVIASNAVGESEPPSAISAQPKLVLNLSDARNFKSDAKPGDIVTTKPHLLGTDYLGRDLLARLLTGTRISLSVGLLAPILFVFVGIVYGAIAGYLGGFIDNVMMRFADILVTIPNLLILIMLQVVMGSGPLTLVCALVIADWAGVSQQIRGEVLRIRDMEYIHAAELLGTSFSTMLFKHIFPNIMGTVLVLFSIAIPRVIFTEAFLSFIGLGISPPLPSLGSVTREGAEVMSTYPFALFIPAVLLSLTVLAFNLLGDGTRDALDPKQRGTR